MEFLITQDNNNSMSTRHVKQEFLIPELHYEVHEIKEDNPLVYSFHSHAEYEIIFVLDRHLDYVINGNVYHLKPHEALLINGNALHGHTSMNAAHGPYQAFLFDIESLFPNPDSYIYKNFVFPLLSGQYTFTKHITGQTPYEQEALTIIKNLILYTQDIPDSTLSIQISLLRIFDIMFQAHAFDIAPKSHPHKELVKIALHYMQQNYTSEISVQSIARYLNISVDHFYRIFKTDMTISPIEYIQNLRIKHAISEMNRHMNYSITKIALNSGFSDSNYFSRVFKNKMGCSPSEYRMKLNHSLK